MQRIDELIISWSQIAGITEYHDRSGGLDLNIGCRDRSPAIVRAMTLRLVRQIWSQRWAMLDSQNAHCKQSRDLVALPLDNLDLMKEGHRQRNDADI